MFYRNRNKLKNAKVLLDLAKKRYKIFIDAINFVKACENIDYVMVDTLDQFCFYILEFGSGHLQPFWKRGLLRV